jgi:hypothetical protein
MFICCKHKFNQQLLKKLTVTQLVKKFPISMHLGSLLSCSLDESLWLKYQVKFRFYIIFISKNRAVIDAVRTSETRPYGAIFQQAVMFIVDTMIT